MSNIILSTKLYNPPVRANGVSRPRLTDKLLSSLGREANFVLLTGPAGFGKTTLLSDFVASLKRPVAWVSLDEADDDPIRFWSYVISACQSIHPGVGVSAMEILRSQLPQSPETITTSLINDLANLDQELILILDDYHSIRNEAIHTAFLFLLEHLPAAFHVVISTRVDPPWPLSRFRARNQLVEVRAQDLRFTTEEASSFLNRVMGLDLSPMDVSALEERTEGWIAGLQLAALSMKGRNDIAGFVKAFTGSNVYIAEYLVEEVLKRQPEYVQTFLLQSSILERMTGELCEAVVGCEDGKAILLDLFKENLFVTRMDDEGQWFRFYHLFRDLLKARLRQNLSEDSIAILHGRAAAWFEKMNMVPESIEQSISAGDYPHVCKLVEKIALPMLLQGYIRTVERWLQSIPSKFSKNNARINMAFAWMNLTRGTITQAAPYLNQLEIIFSSDENKKNDPSIYGEWLTLRSQELNGQGKPAESRDTANQALQILPETDIHLRSMAYVNLASAYQQMLDYGRAGETFQMIVRNAQVSGDYTFETLGISGHARMLLLQGHLHQTFEVASEGLKRIQTSGRYTPFSATIYGELGQVYYHWHKLDQERKYTLLSMQASGKNGFSDPEIFNYITLSKIHQMEGNWEAARGDMQKASDLKRLLPPAMIREDFISQQIRVMLAFGQFKEAQELIKEDGFTFGDAFDFPVLAPDAPLSHTACLLYNSAFRILLALVYESNDPSNLQRGVEIADRIVEREIACHNIPAAIETLLILSQMNSDMGNEQERLINITQALEMAQPEGFISIFLEEGKSIAEGLELLIKHGLPGTLRRVFVQEIRDAYPKSIKPLSIPEGLKTMKKNHSDFTSGMENCLVEPLTDRELEVLQLIASGDSNQAIADKLVISVSAVKKHSSNIFGKLNVNSRTHAVAKARQLGILPFNEQ